jgi:hypothetical protein
MAEDVSEIVARWRENVPPEVSKEEVEKVVEAYFPQTRKYRGKSGSHWLIVEDADLKFAEENGFPTGTTQGIMTFSLVGGKRVKAYQVKNLLAAITVKEAAERHR